MSDSSDPLRRTTIALGFIPRQGWLCPSRPRAFRRAHPSFSPVLAFEAVSATRGTRASFFESVSPQPCPRNVRRTTNCSSSGAGLTSSARTAGKTVPPYPLTPFPLCPRLTRGIEIRDPLARIPPPPVPYSCGAYTHFGYCRPELPRLDVFALRFWPAAGATFAHRVILVTCPVAFHRDAMCREERWTTYTPSDRNTPSTRLALDKYMEVYSTGLVAYHGLVCRSVRAVGKGGGRGGRGMASSQPPSVSWYVCFTPCVAEYHHGALCSVRTMRVTQASSWHKRTQESKGKARIPTGKISGKVASNRHQGLYPR